MSDTISISLTQQSDYQFLIDFGAGIAPLVADEPPPLGQGQGPQPDHLLLAGVANCLTASLLFALRKYKQDPRGITARVTGTVDRNENKRLRVFGIQVDLGIGAEAGEIQHLERALAQFEEFCTVSQSVQAGIPITVTVTDGTGRRLK